MEETICWSFKMSSSFLSMLVLIGFLSSSSLREGGLLDSSLRGEIDLLLEGETLLLEEVTILLGEKFSSSKKETVLLEGEKSSSLGGKTVLLLEGETVLLGGEKSSSLGGKTVLLLEGETVLLGGEKSSSSGGETVLLEGTDLREEGESALREEGGFLSDATITLLIGFSSCV